ncbi:MAG TPA: class C beta-lactamase [Steroidobacteraceae bacterium]|nr:class C beta-lactamase [Steroidobacteraceae bacterium]
MRKLILAAAALLPVCASIAAAHAADSPAATASVAAAALGHVVDGAIRPVLEEYRIPGMAVGIAAGEHSYVFNYGVEAIASRRPVSDSTLFELGSVSKTFTATLAAYAEIRGYLSLSDTAGKYLRVLRGSQFGDVTLLELGTHTPGGMPLQVPDDVHDIDGLMQYFRRWRPTYAPGTYRTYANPSIGTLGLITAKSRDASFDALMERQLLPALGMRNTYLHVPAARMADYAEGYASDNDSPIRMKPGVLWMEAYGIKSTAADMVRFLQANMGSITLDPQLEGALIATHTGYFQAGVMTQDLIWEQYPYPVDPRKLLTGNSDAMIFDATPVTRISPPEPPRQDVWINKTGSTNGFGAYVAFIPKERLGIVILANRSYPIDARVTAAYRILTALGRTDAMH